MRDVDVRNRALNLEKQIRELQNDLRSPADTGGPAAPKLAVDDAKRLKRTVDDFRLFLWAYADAWSKEGEDISGKLQRIRLQAVADMLNLLRAELAGKGLPQNVEGRAIRLALQNFSQTVL